MSPLPDEIARRAVLYSERYINDRFLPDKAIDLLDEACSCANLRNKTLAQYDEYNRQIKVHQHVIESEEHERITDVDYEKLAENKAKIAPAAKSGKRTGKRSSGSEGNR